MLSLREHAFTTIYERNYWGSSETRSGIGSELQNTICILSNIPLIVETYSIKTIFDAGCGDWNWFKEIKFDIDYTGADIVKPLIDDLKQRYQRSNVNFIHTDVVLDQFAYYDLVIARAILFHFSNDELFRFLFNFRESQSKFLLTTHSGDFVNVDGITGGWRPLNLFAPPFSFPSPIYTFDDANNTKKICLFERSQLLEVLDKRI